MSTDLAPSGRGARVLRVLLAALTLLCAVAPALAQDMGQGGGARERVRVSSMSSRLYLLAVSVSDGKQQPIARADVVLDGEVLGLTDDSGRYFLARRPLPPGAHRLEVSRTGYETREQSVDLPEDDEPGVSVAVTLEPEAPLSRRYTPAGAPNYRVIQIFFATDRKDTGSADPYLRYANARAPDGALSRGTYDVSIPYTHESGTLESPSLFRLEYIPDPNRHVVLLNADKLAPDAFYRKLSERLAKSRSGEIVVFVHGFNNSFEEGARKMAQLAWDLQLDGAPVLYSWPSRNLVFAYGEDEETVQWSAAHLSAFLEELAAHTHARKIHLIAHSLGNRALAAALQEIAAKHGAQRPPAYDQVVLAAPDIGSDTMNVLAREVRPIARRMTLYASKSDDALLLSRYLHAGVRSGRDDYLLVAPGIDTIDASSARTDLLGHAYYNRSVDIISDIRKIFATEASPEARSLIPALLRDLRYWIIPPGTVTTSAR
jgi:esterase/lipase superfamily enzyme